MLGRSENQLQVSASFLEIGSNLQTLTNYIQRRVWKLELRLRDFPCWDILSLSTNQGKRISNPIDTTVLGFIQNAKKFKSTTLGRRVGLTF